MSLKTAQVAFIGLNLLACMAVGYLGYDIYRVEQAIRLQAEIISYDSGNSFLLLSSVFWLFSLIQFLGLRKSKSIVFKRANEFVLAWFIATLVIAYSIPQLQKSRFEKASYVACDNPRSISRVSRGKSLIYVKVNDNQLARLPEGADKKYVCLMLEQIAD
ncbi:hypothetical protein WG68_11205 [Arsukibacterium ikkense]|uniref:Uncharacterized protein n=1 Tax=Arsukibacterium ikkense TaxID=336831 RepID=A0A0M2V4F3_9GAMM|nr:hypothetical protein [Arsukibacterium ikkense]KKO45284.1 hypothetical protein WG68_11205 [Arsukibacterium ikkense]